jgi:hypothetical protein
MIQSKGTIILILTIISTLTPSSKSENNNANIKIGIDQILDIVSQGTEILLVSLKNATIPDIEKKILLLNIKIVELKIEQIVIDPKNILLPFPCKDNIMEVKIKKLKLILTGKYQEGKEKLKDMYIELNEDKTNADVTLKILKTKENDTLIQISNIVIHHSVEKADTDNFILNLLIKSNLLGSLLDTIANQLIKTQGNQKLREGLKQYLNNQISIPNFDYFDLIINLLPNLNCDENFYMFVVDIQFAKHKNETRSSLDIENLQELEYLDSEYNYNEKKNYIDISIQPSIINNLLSLLSQEDKLVFDINKNSVVIPPDVAKYIQFNTNTNLFKNNFPCFLAYPDTDLNIKIKASKVNIPKITVEDYLLKLSLGLYIEYTPLNKPLLILSSFLTVAEVEIKIKSIETNNKLYLEIEKFTFEKSKVLEPCGTLTSKKLDDFLNSFSGFIYKTINEYFLKNGVEIKGNENIDIKDINIIPKNGVIEIELDAKINLSNNKTNTIG